jgi:23S rRNA (guanosine2251-2'-O)-methyltransferase
MTMADQDQDPPDENRFDKPVPEANRFDKPVRPPTRATAPGKREAGKGPARQDGPADRGGPVRFDRAHPRPPAPRGQGDERPPPQDRGFGDRPPPQNRGFGDRPPPQNRGFGDRPPPQNRGPGDRPPPRGADRPRGGDRPRGNFGDRPPPPRDRNFDDRPRNAEDRQGTNGFSAPPGPDRQERAKSDRAPRTPLPADVVTGSHAVEALARFHPQRIREVYLWSQDPRLVARIEALALAQELRLVREPPPGIGPDDPNPQGVAARISAFEYEDLDAIVPVTGAPEGTLLIVLDSITDPRNLGAILRSAAFFQATAVVLPTDRTAEVTSLVERIAEGGSATVPVIQVVNLARTLKALRERGVEVVGTALDGATGDLRDHKWAGATAIVLGAEGVGIRPLVRKNCDVLLTLEGPETMPSLNVAAFATLTLALARGAKRPGRAGVPS